MKKLKLGVPVSPTGLVIFSIGSVQLGSAIAKSLLAETSPAGIVLLRVGFAAIVLFCLWQPRLNDRVYASRWLLFAFGCALALMNLSFYRAIERIPLGIAVALEFIGPLGIALVHSRRWLDGLWVLLAGTGIILLTPFAGVTLDPLGIGLAMVAGMCWAVYILLSARIGQTLEGGEGLAWAMAIATLILLPIGVFTEGTALLQPHLLLMGFGVALLSSAIPYSLDLAALRGLSVKVFGILLSLEPVAAALAALLILNERLSPQAIAAILIITLAAAGSSYFAPRQPHQN
ncbi:EamA family transporter [Stenomitos frigidus]|uniref:EamA family transporter n=1 Tax=Stenomitos frigidus ULC18 TaxID=2107698 RepID=A0A2T1DUX1_9CYAN|nr:EamA family transporter [Stenomitos frigidus]PSB24262.1 EamA family transporter [Stenomitos frigidus ULC18]